MGFWNRLRNRHAREPIEWVVLGIGNPGPEYDQTRHNVGWEVVDLLARRHSIRLNQRKHRARFGVGQVGGVPVLLVKPHTYVNRTGFAAHRILTDWNLPTTSLLVIVDDVHLPPGRIRVRRGGSHGGHNGLRSLIDSLQTQDFPRIRIGVGTPASPDIDLATHVLSPFSAEERPLIDEAIARAADAVERTLTVDIETAMNDYNA